MQSLPNHTRCHLRLIARCRGWVITTWLNDVLERIVSGEVRNNELDQLLAWNWKAQREAAAEVLAAAA